MTILLSGCVRTVYVESNSADGSGTEGFRIGYQEGTTVVEDPEALQKAVDEMTEKAKDTVGLEYKNDAFSENGIDYDCYIANAERNQYDMFIAIYADAEMTDELFLSGLIPPGRALDHIHLNHALDPGANTVYVAFSQIDEIDGEQVMHAQVMVTMAFNVSDNGVLTVQDAQVVQDAQN